MIGLYAEEDIRNAQGTVLVRKGTLLESSLTAADGLAVFESDLPYGYQYAVQEISAPEGYRVSEERPEFIFEKEEGESEEVTEVRLAIKDQPNDVKIETEKSAPEKAEENEIICYTIEKIRNTGNCTVDNFTLTDRLPAQVKLIELRTGTFEGLKAADHTYSLWYQTNQNGEYRLWREAVSADMNLHLLTADLNLKEGEEVTAFQYRFGTVEKDFTEIEKPEYLVQVKTDRTDGEELLNHIELTGEKLGITYTAEDETITRIEKPEKPDGSSEGSSPVQPVDVPTGDDTPVSLYLCLSCAAAAALAGILHGRKKRLKFCGKFRKMKGEK